MARRSGTRLTGKKTHFVKGLAEGLPQEKAALRAGYSEQTARKTAYQILQRPLVCSAFTDALQRAGITWDQIVKPVKDALETTTHLEDPLRKRLIDTGIPDLKVRQQAHDRAVSLFGGIPKVG
jgi:phage terminase small subunit